MKYLLRLFKLLIFMFNFSLPAHGASLQTARAIMGGIEPNYELILDDGTTHKGYMVQNKFFNFWVTKGGFVGEDVLLEGFERDGKLTLSTGTVGPDAIVYGNVILSNNFRIVGHARVSGHARIEGTPYTKGLAQVLGYAEVCDHAQVLGESIIDDFAKIREHAKIETNVIVDGEAEVAGRARITGWGSTCSEDHARVGHSAKVLGDSVVHKTVTVLGEYVLNSPTPVKGNITLGSPKDWRLYRKTQEQKEKWRRAKIAKIPTYHISPIEDYILSEEELEKPEEEELKCNFFLGVPNYSSSSKSAFKAS